jgi:hypothetical protein
MWKSDMSSFLLQILKRKIDVNGLQECGEWEEKLTPLVVGHLA